MNKKKLLLNWAKNLHDGDLQKHFRQKNPLVRTPDTVFDTILMRIKAGVQPEEKTVKLFFTFPAVGAAAAAALLFTAVFLFFTLYQFPPEENQEICNISSLKGQVLISAGQGSKAAFAGDNLVENSSVESGGDSAAVLQIGRKSQVEMGENSKVKILKLFKNNGIEKTGLYLEQGVLHCRQLKDLNGSSFSIETESLELFVIGTEFLVSIKNHTTEVKVIHGRVSIKPNIHVTRLQAIRDLNSDVADRITEILEDKIIISAEEKLSLSMADVEKTEQGMEAILAPIQEALETNKEPDTNRLSAELEKMAEIKQSLLNERKNLSNQSLLATPEHDITASIKKTKQTIIRILSPAHKYYEQDPLLNYELINPGDVEIYLNGNPLPIENNTVLSGSLTGYNTLQIISINAKGEETEKQIEYFVNKLALTETDNFNRADSDSIGNLWIRYAGQLNDRIGKISNDNLVFSGPTNLPRAYCVLFKYFQPLSDREILQVVDITGFKANKNTSVILELGISGSGSSNPGYYVMPLYSGHGAAIHVVLETADGRVFSLQLQEHRYWPVNRVWDMSPKKTVMLDFSTPKRLVFYKKQRSFYGLVTDSDGTVLGEVVNQGYSSRLEPSLLSFYCRKIAGYVPERIPGNDVLMSITNYYFFR